MPYLFLILILVISSLFNALFTDSVKLQQNTDNVFCPQFDMNFLVDILFLIYTCFHSYHMLPVKNKVGALWHCGVLWPNGDVGNPLDHHIDFMEEDQK